MAIKANVNYADLSSEPTEEQRRKVKDAKITAVSGLGVSPGLSNILAKDDANSLDETDTIEINWASFRTIAPSPGLLETVFEELASSTKTRQYYFMGRFVHAEPFEGSKVVCFPEPVGKQVVYYAPHTETTSLPKHIPGVRYVAVRGTWRPRTMEDVMVLNRYGLLDDVEVDYKRTKVNVYDFVTQAAWRKLGGKVDEDLWALFLNVEVTGRKGSRHVKRTYNVSHPIKWRDKATAKMTGINGSVGAILLARHGRKITGIVDPEQYYEPKEYLEELNKRGTIKVELTEETTG